MKHFTVLAIVALALGACSERATPERTFDKASQPGPTPGPQACSPLPAGVTMPMAHQLRSDVFYVNKDGLIRRRVVEHVLEGDMSAAIAAMDRAMAAGGFSRLDQREAIAKRVHVRYRRNGYGVAHLFFDAVSTAGSPVRAVITFDLPPPSFNPPPAKRPKQ